MKPGLLSALKKSLSFMDSVFRGIPIIGDIIKADDAKKEVAREDRMAPLEAEAKKEEARQQKLQYEADARQAELDYGNTKTAQQETLLNKELTEKMWDQKIGQKNVEGQKTIGTQTALQAATGQIGAGSALVVSEESKTNLQKDLTQMGATKDLESEILSTKAAGYETAMKLLMDQADASKEAAGNIGPEQIEEDYMNAYTG